MKNKKILIVDDDKDFIRKISYTLQDDFFCRQALNESECFQQIEDEPDLILMDVEINSAVDGIDIVEKINNGSINIPVIMLSRHSNYKIVKKAMKAGAIDYIVKPPDINELINIINRALQEVALKEKLQYLKSEVKSIYGELIGQSPEMRKTKEFISKASELDCPVLIMGETGTGKGLAARCVHENGKYRNEPFISVNIAAIEKELFLSELFGHEKGAFTGAVTRKKGLFESAGKGTIFLDEIGDLDQHVQVKLLEVLDDRKTKRVGGLKDININARIIAATNKNLTELVKTGKFRKDLFFRLNVFKIEMPVLREMTDDIPLLLKFFLKGKEIHFESNILSILKSYKWPGNVRELRNIIEMLLIHTTTGPVNQDFLNSLLNNKLSNELLQEHNYFDLPYNEAKNNFSKEYLTRLLNNNNNNITKAAEEAGIQRPNLHKLIKSFGLQKSPK